MNRTARASLLVWMSLTTGCFSPAESPKDLDGLARFFFNRFAPKNDDGTDADPAVSDAELQDGVGRLHDVLDGDALTDPMKGTLADLTADELVTAGLPDANAKLPQGMFIADVVRCSLDELETIMRTDDQLSLYPEAYAAYARVNETDRPDYNPTWVSTFTSADNALLSNQFTAVTHSGLRKVPDVEASSGEPARFGRFLTSRVVMPKPATFEQPSDSVAYDNDFQVEVFYPRADDELVHFYGMWRFMKLGVLGDSSSDLFIEQTTGGMIDWDTKTSALCEAP
jgi:hypothetical protein